MDVKSERLERHDMEWEKSIMLKLGVIPEPANDSSIVLVTTNLAAEPGAVTSSWNGRYDIYEGEERKAVFLSCKPSVTNITLVKSEIIMTASMSGQMFPSPECLGASWV